MLFRSAEHGDDRLGRRHHRTHVELLSHLSGPVQLEETPLDGTLVVFNGTVPVSASLYSVVSNKITFTGTQTGIMIRYQTSAFARAGLPARKNFYSPLLFEVRFERL